MKLKSIKYLLFTAVLGLSISFSHVKASAASYKIQSGDSLYKISVLFNTTTSKLISDNKLTSNAIYPGQVLYVACPTYTVKSGDSLSLIAKSYGVPLMNLRIANSIYTDTIYPGQVLNIPGKISSTINYTASDVDLLGRLINAEAEGESYTAKVAVGAVIVNRVKSTIFPNSISSVIYQVSYGYYQFTPVLNGQINKPATADSIKAAYAALSGQDPTNGALYFYDHTVTNTWLLSKPVSATYGSLTFAY